jgi:hypothetical protein
MECQQPVRRHRILKGNPRSPRGTIHNSADTRLRGERDQGSVSHGPQLDRLAPRQRANPRQDDMEGFGPETFREEGFWRVVDIAYTEIGNPAAHLV